MEREMIRLRSENTALNEMVELERSKLGVFEKKIVNLEYDKNELQQRLYERESQIKDLQRQLNQKQYVINQKEMENENQKRKISSKIATETEKMSRDLANKHRMERDILQVSLIIIFFTFLLINIHFKPLFTSKDRLRSKDNQLKTITRILSNGESVENINANIQPRLKSTSEAPATPKRQVIPMNFSTPRPPAHRVS